MKIKLAVSVLIGTVVAIPAAALAFVKPLRVVVPAIMPGISCPDADVCIDDIRKLGDARALYHAGFESTTEAVGPFLAAPRVVFCTTQACAETFGLGSRAAMAVGNSGLIIAPRGWAPFYLAHEMIHHRQAESLGNIALLTKPGWLIEGMAYALSKDPRATLSEPFAQWRAQFDAWYADVDPHDLWNAARAVP
ncbi:hypothetical protein CupriaWKF_28340 [Cupriavidus sp. WKF15]|uniref:hypothetical protein n=1 Tax=Cupriavidus sp. WKF15 TaxID=3032282 RepID=UPI0023E32E7F|nr:hypothetical protein [Cupriavidus sp. WKF15]WER48676.1 hypothetical protein CupriaWKF_28340 [Cupriavidus sp. WKF15]